MLKVLSFKVADSFFGIDINEVKEINRNVEYTDVPRSPEEVVGLFNMRGQVVTLFSLARIFGYELESQKGKATCIILSDIPGSPNQKGFLIDKSGDVLDINEDICEEPPANVEGQEYKYVKKIARMDNQLVLIIDTARIFEIQLN